MQINLMPRVGIMQVRDVILMTSVNSTSTSKRRPIFAFTFFSALTHHGLNEARYMDELLERFFWSLHESGSLENTAVVLLSDHGVRYGVTRGCTRMGWYEENLPMLLIAMPASFRRRHVNMTMTLRNNQNKLTTPLDVHETIRRLLYLGSPYNDTHRAAHGRRGVSLFDVTLGDRTCKDASIASTYCECDLSNSHPVDVKSEQVIRVRMI